MKNIFLLSLFLILILPISGFMEKINSSIDFLCGSDFKEWKLMSSSGSTPSCVVPNSATSDNKYVFYRNGNYFFNPGTITSYEDSTSCFDPVAHSGRWEFLNNENKLKISALLTDSSGVYEQTLVESYFLINNQGQLILQDTLNGISREVVFTPW